MKVNEVVNQPEVKIYPYNIPNFLQWETIRDSGKWSKIKVGNDFDCGDDYKLNSLKGCPQIISGDFFCKDNRLITLNDGPTHVYKNYSASSNNIKTLKDIHKHIRQIGEVLYLHNNPIQSHILGLLLIKELRKVYSVGNTFFSTGNAIFEIINNHIGRDRDVLECQEELISAGYKEYAKL